MTFVFLTNFCPNYASFILGFNLEKRSWRIQFFLLLTIWIHLPCNFKCFWSGHVRVSSCDCQNNWIWVADELKDQLSYLKFNVLRLITNRHLEKKQHRTVQNGIVTPVWKHSLKVHTLYHCIRKFSSPLLPPSQTNMKEKEDLERCKSQKHS